MAAVVRTGFRHGAAVLSVAIAIAARLMLDPVVGYKIPFATLFLAVVVSAWYGGLWPGLSSVILGGFAASYFLLEPRGSFAIAGVEEQAGMALYLLTGFSISLLAGSMHAARRRAEANAELKLQLEARVAEQKAREKGQALVLELAHVRSLLRDATEIHRTEERFQHVVEAAPSALIMVSADGSIVLVNVQTEKLFGYERSELLGHPIEMLVPERFLSGHKAYRDTFFAAPVARAMGEGRDLFAARKDGREVPVEIGLNPIVTSEGQFVLASIIDVTERKRFEAELQSRAAEMERFTYTVSHDLKSPLITIKSYIAMIDRDLADGNPERTRSDLQRVTKAADRMGMLLEEVLALSQVGRVENARETVTFASLVAEALEQVDGRIRQKQIHVEVAGELPWVTVDRRRMVEVLQNLIDNAAKFMGKQAAPAIGIGAMNDGVETRFFVKDNGVGLDAKYHQRIFGLFDKLNPKSEGAGAGLAIAKRSVELHGGRIWVESPGHGGGSTFWFTLNALPQQGERERAAKI